MVECPLIEIVRTSDEPIDCAGYEWAVITSPNGADEVARRARNLPAKVAAVGPGTAETLRKHGIEPAFVASVSTADHLAAEFPKPDGKVIFLAAENSRRGPIDALEADFVPLYSTVLLEPEPPDGDVVVLASGSAARAYSWIGGKAPAVSIGPETTRVAGSVGLEVAVEAETHDLEGLIAAVGEFARVALLMYDTITFLTDFGLQDDFVGVCRGVMKRIARDAQILDVTHGIAPQAVRQGALVLARAIPYLPPGIHLAVVDPGVGSERRARRRPDGRRPRLRRPRQRPAHARRRPRRRRGARAASRTRAITSSRSRRRSTPATCSRPSRRTLRPARTSTTSARTSIWRRSFASSCPWSGSRAASSWRRSSTSTASATSG